MANDNAASVSFEGLVGNLVRVGAVDLARLDRFQYVPYEGLVVEVAKIQELKASFFERFWETSGKVAVRTLAAAAAEVGLFSAIFLSFCFFLLVLSIWCRRRLLIVLRRIIECPRIRDLLRGLVLLVLPGHRSKD